MGIQNLLPTLKSITVRKHVSEYKGLVVGIDAYTWLHKGVYSCAMELATGKKTDAHIRFCIKRLEMLLYFGIKPYFVFDGGPLPMKAHQEHERKSNRDRSLAEAFTARAKGDDQAAHGLFARAVDVTPEMAQEFIFELQNRGITYLVAPYEADAQLAYLYLNGYIQAVITEDSDLLPFGLLSPGCGRVLFKMDHQGYGDEIEKKNLGLVESVSFDGFTDDMFLDMCILSGCDYLPNISGIGMRKAQIMVKKHKKTDKILSMLRWTGSRKQVANIPDTFEIDFFKAKFTFLHQTVFDPKERKLVPLRNFTSELLKRLPKIRDNMECLEFLGPYFDNRIAEQIAVGNYCPATKTPFLHKASTILLPPHYVPVSNSPQVLGHMSPNPTLPPDPYSSGSINSIGTIDGSNLHSSPCNGSYPGIMSRNEKGPLSRPQDINYDIHATLQTNMAHPTESLMQFATNSTGNTDQDQLKGQKQVKSPFFARTRQSHQLSIRKFCQQEPDKNAGNAQSKAKENLNVPYAVGDVRKEFSVRPFYQSNMATTDFVSECVNEETFDPAIPTGQEISRQHQEDRKANISPNSQSCFSQASDAMSEEAFFLHSRFTNQSKKEKPHSLNGAGSNALTNLVIKHDMSLLIENKRPSSPEFDGPISTSPIDDNAGIGVNHDQECALVDPDPPKQGNAILIKDILVKGEDGTTVLMLANRDEAAIYEPSDGQLAELPEDGAKYVAAADTGSFYNLKTRVIRHHLSSAETSSFLQIGSQIEGGVVTQSGHRGPSKESEIATRWASLMERSIYQGSLTTTNTVLEKGLKSVQLGTIQSALSNMESRVDNMHKNGNKEMLNPLVGTKAMNIKTSTGVNPYFRTASVGKRIMRSTTGRNMLGLVQISSPTSVPSPAIPEPQTNLSASTIGTEPLPQPNQGNERTEPNTKIDQLLFANFAYRGGPTGKRRRNQHSVLPTRPLSFSVITMDSPGKSNETHPSQSHTDTRNRNLDLNDESSTSTSSLSVVFSNENSLECENIPFSPKPISKAPNFCTPSPPLSNSSTRRYNFLGNTTPAQSPLPRMNAKGEDPWCNSHSTASSHTAFPFQKTRLNLESIQPLNPQFPSVERNENLLDRNRTNLFTSDTSESRGPPGFSFISVDHNTQL